MERKSTSPVILDYFLKHEGQTITRPTLMTELDLTAKQVAAGVYNLWDRDVAGSKTNLEIVQQGNTWIWRSHSKPTGRLYEELATTKSGLVLVQDEDGEIYRLEKL